MQIRYTDNAEKQLLALPVHLQKKARKQFIFLLADIRHPSLNIKKYEGFGDLWQGRIDKGYRFYFHIVAPDYIIISIINHPK
jgi:mRNA-degrading endonuclease RelE of RelBE toxin-antitoxin system